LNSVGLLMGISPQAIRYAVLGIETVYEGVQKRSTCDVLYGIEIFTNLKKFTNSECFYAAFDRMLKTMSAVAPNDLKKQEDEEIFSLCFELPSLLKGIKPSLSLVEFGSTYGRYIVLSEKVRNTDCMDQITTAKNNLLKAKMNLENEWKGSRLARVFLQTVLEPIYSEYEDSCS